MSADQVDTVVIGAGVVGLAVARALALQGHEVMVLEAAETFGTQTSARNSEVIHAGIYYPAESLKSRLCVQGKQMLYGYCAERGIAHRRCGKLIVATSAGQVDELLAIQQRAAANGVDDLQRLTREQAQALEPALECHAALLSPSTGIVDSHGLMLSLLGDLEHAGGLLAVNSKVKSLAALDGQAHDAIKIEVSANGEDTTLAARQVVNAAGLHAPALAVCTQGLDARHVPRAHCAKGSYFTLSGRAPFGRLVYPVPEPGGLGVHLTLDLGGQAKFGPDVQWVDSPDNLQVDAARGDAFYAQVRRYWPELRDGALQPGYAGIRPKISGPGEAAADFVVQGPREHGVRGLVNLFGIESPGLTSCLAVAEEVAVRLD
ncbi:NAD(P)/FAD-dependent oxidoreductase [Ottowia testudinis]|uniref:NAD(P)/FAD-dependent oxidoreductase n=1 Tax=Ottowia testudinis TaxID=2816950 RepID=A0A975CDW9_9BURK|nr:NAD(P)/FAD-dependent oxidoreductase [Ottowia testudinis]QTD43734.1 NAD(P)/FAD-dependent oxidoreductase [Ottowia testudinis]